MPPIVKQIQDEMTNIEKTHQELDSLIKQKERVEERIRRVERNHTDDRVSQALSNLRDITDSIGDLQNALNLIWKKTKHTEAELKEIQSMPFELSRQNGNLLQ